MKGIWKDKKLQLIVLTIVYLLLRLPLIDTVPLIRDEGPYAIMIEEQIAHPTLAMTFLDTVVGWKPPLFFWNSGLFVTFLRGLDFLPIEAVYRLPIILFGLINVYLVYLILEKLIKERDEVFLTTLLYTTLFIAVHTELRVMTDSLCGTAVLAGILFYLNGYEDRRFFLLGGIFTFIAYFVKQSNAALIPVVAASYLFEKDRRTLRNPFFLISLLAFPIASWLFNAIFNVSVGATDTYILQYTITNNLNLTGVVQSIIPYFLSMSVWMAASVFGFWKNWSRNLTLSVWFALIVFPLIAGGWMPWYYYPVLLPIAYFSVQLLIRDIDGKKVIDRFFLFVLLILMASAFGLGLLYNLSLKDSFGHEKDAGEFLAGKDNVLIIGEYAPSIFAYKMLEEKRENGTWKDFGWIMLGANGTEAEYNEFINDYWSNRTKVVDNNYMGLFGEPAIYRKKTNITHFDYIVVVSNQTIDPGGKLVFNESITRIYEIR